MSNMRASSPYGTRSRNRGARVNYAEDKDNEMDFELSATYNPTSPTSKPAGDATTSGTSRRQLAAGPAAGKDSKDGKDAAPTALTATTTNSVAGKKRKGGAAAAAAAQAAISSMMKDASLSNMLSFDRPFLKDGKLISDDGTVLVVHGT